MEPHWKKVNDDRYERADGARVQRKVSGTWTWFSPEGDGAAGAKGKRTADEAMAHVDAEWPLEGVGPAESHRLPPREDLTLPELPARWWEMEPGAFAEAARRARRPERLEGGVPTSRLQRYADELDRERLPAMTPRTAAMEDRFQQMSPDSFARMIGQAIPSVRPDIETAMQAELARSAGLSAARSSGLGARSDARSSGSFSPLPPPVAVLPAPTPTPSPSRTTPGTGPITEKSPGTVRPSTVVTRPWAPSPPLLRQARRTEAPTRAQTREQGTYAQTIAACSTQAVKEALERNPGNVSAAARELGLSRKGVYGVMRRMGWEAPEASRAVRAASGAAGARARWGD